MGWSRVVIFLWAMLPFLAEAQEDRYIVYLKDKIGTPYSVSNPQQFLSARSLERRLRQKIEIKEEDLPVNPNYLSQLRSTGAGVFFSSRWMNCVLVQSSATQLLAVKSLPFVSKTELVAPGKKLSSGRIKKFKQKKDYAATPAASGVRSTITGLFLEVMTTEYSESIFP